MRNEEDRGVKELKIATMFLAQMTVCKIMPLTELQHKKNSKIFMMGRINEFDL